MEPEQQHPNEPILEAILQNQDDNAKSQEQLLEAILEKSDTEPLLEAQLTVLDRIEKKLDPKEIGDGASFIVKGLKGDKGEDGHTPTDEELASLIKPLVPEPIPGKDGQDGKDGYSPIKGRDYFDGKDAEPIDEKLLAAQITAKIRVPKDGKDGKDGIDGKDAKDITPKFIKEVESRLKKYDESNLLWVNNGAVKSVIAGTNISVTGDPQNPIISSTGGGGTSDHALLSNLDYASAGHTGFQPTLVSGTNIKTVNGSSLLGSGDLSVSAAAGGSNGEVQYNNVGALDGFGSWDGTTFDLDAKQIAAHKFIVGDGFVSPSNQAYELYASTGDAHLHVNKISGGQEIIFDFSSIPGATARTYTVPNDSGTLALQGWVSGQGYLMSESDPIFSAHAASSITGTDITNLGNLSGTNSGDQTTIVGITGTKAEFDTACSDGDFLYVGDVNAITLQTDGTPNGSQSLLNLVAGTNITLTDNGTGSVTIDSTGGAGSGITRTITTTSGSTTMGSTASVDYVYFVAGAHTMSLPSPNTNRYTVKNNHSANITIDTAGAETIEGAASISIAPGESVDIISDATDWFVL